MRGMIWRLIPRGTYCPDGHKPDDDKGAYILPKDKLEGPTYQIPLGSLAAKDGQNLMTAGRCFSADQLVLSSARVSTTGLMMGQASGLATVISVHRKWAIRDLDPRDVIKTIIKKGANLSVWTVSLLEKWLFPSGPLIRHLLLLP